MPTNFQPYAHLLAIGLVLLFIAIVFATSGLFLIRRRVSLSELKTNQDVAGVILTVVAQAYVVLISFVVIVVWGQYTDTENLTMQEAACIGSMYWLTQGLPDPVAHQLQISLRNYTRDVVDEEWPLMAKGVDLNGVPDQAWADHDLIWKEINEFSPTTPKETNGALELLEEMRSLDQDRRMRLLSAQRRMPSLMWVVLVGSGFITVAYTYLFGSKHIWVQAGMTVGLVAVIGLILVLISELDTPFSGTIQIHPTGYQSLLGLMNLYLGP